MENKSKIYAGDYFSETESRLIFFDKFINCNANHIGQLKLVPCYRLNIILMFSGVTCVTLLRLLPKNHDIDCYWLF